jgi:hypothetical protein
VKKLLFVAALLASSIVLPDGAAAQTHKAIVPGEVEVTGSGIKGSFEVVESASGIVSTGTGGACLVFSKGPHGGAACKADSDCTLDPEFAGGYAYCLDREHDRGKNGKCWVRPGNYCLRSPTVPHPLGQKIEFPLDAAGNLQPVSNPVSGWWRVHACLAGQIPGACGDATNPDKMLSDGPPRKIP